MDSHTLQVENLNFVGTKGISKNSRSLGFSPAFLNKTTGRIELAKLGNGQPAAMHIISWLPREWAETLDDKGRVLSLNAGIIAGFVQQGVFYTRQEVAEL